MCRLCASHRVDHPRVCVSNTTLRKGKSCSLRSRAVCATLWDYAGSTRLCYSILQGRLRMRGDRLVAEWRAIRREVGWVSWYDDVPPRCERGGYIYKAWDSEGRCLYVGRTTDPRSRMKTHAQKGSPWLLVTNKMTWTIVDEWELSRAEMSAIRLLKPMYNIRGRGE